MALVGQNSEFEVKRLRREPGGDVLRPLYGEAIGRREKVLEHEIVELFGAVEAIGVEVDECARLSVLRAVQREDRERGARDGLSETEAAGKSLDEGGFADAEIAMECEDNIGGQGGGQFAGESLRLVRRRRNYASAEFIVDVRSHGSRRG